LPPEFDGVSVHVELRSQCLIGLAFAGTQENAAMQHYLLGCRMGGFPAFQADLVFD
jgi:hypothetical protein